MNGWRSGRTTEGLGAVRRALMGPAGLALLSALMLSGYWLGGAGLLLVAGMVGPAAMVFWAQLAESPRRHGRDGVTGLPLGWAAVAALESALSQAGLRGNRPLCIALRIDGFETLQTRYGEAAADQLLHRLAARIAPMMGEGDTLVRLDGPQFAVVLSTVPAPALESAIQIAARLLAAVAEPIALGAARLHLTACAGFASGRAGESAQAQLDAALSALAEARRQGAGSIRAHVPGASRIAPAPGHLVAEAADALESGAVQPFFQPQVSTDTGEIAGMEALARWVHPRLGVLLPGEFLPAIATAGLMERLTARILAQSLAALREWERHGYRVPTVSINLDEGDLSDPALPDRIRWELDRWDLPPERLVVEILETVLASAANQVLHRNIARLLDMGVGIDLDDFGTGAASLAAIRRFGVHRIKIDRSFITRLDRDRSQQDMVAAILSMADRLGLPALAEGVETPAEHALLAQLGCATVQGFAIARPMPLADTMAWMERTAAAVAQTRALGRKVI